jgi:hypothetical protein
LIEAGTSLHCGIIKINGGDNRTKTITRKKGKRRINTTKILESYLEEQK